MQYHCRVCGHDKDESEFWAKRSRHRCKACLNESMRKRYNQKYKKVRADLRVGARKARVKLAVRHTQTERAYMAGIVDGEGYISLLVHGRGGGTSMRVGRVTMSIGVVNTNLGLMEWIAKRWNASLFYEAADHEGNRKPRWRWALNANNALHLLDEIYPYMVAKRAQAKLAIRFQRYLQYTGKSRNERKSELQLRFADEMKKLNHRGLRP